MTSLRADFANERADAKSPRAKAARDSDAFMMAIIAVGQKQSKHANQACVV